MASVLKLTFDYGTDQEVRDAFAGLENPIAIAATAAMGEVGDQAKVLGRAAIAAGGFSTRWQNTYRNRLYPVGRVTMEPAAFLWHKIPYASVFETGATILGKPLMFLPTRAAPKRIGVHRMTPRMFNRRVGPLFSFRAKGRIFLGVRARVSEAQIRAGEISLSKLRGTIKPGPGQEPLRTVALFVGVPVVKLRKRFNIAAATAKAAEQFPARYFKHLKPE